MAQQIKRAKLADIAKSAGVSKSTVSLAFSAPQRVGPETRTRILDAAAAAGYSPDPLAQSLSRGRSNTIGLIVPDLTNPHFGTVLDGVQAAAYKAGYMVMTATASNDSKRDLDFVNRFEKLRLSGVIFTGSGHTPAYAQTLAKSPMRFLTYGQRIPDLSCDHVGLENDEATRILVQHLINRGHSRIGHIAGNQNTWTGRQRLDGVRTALSEAGLSLKPQDTIYGNYDEKTSQTVTSALLSTPDRPTALIAANNVTAVGAMRAVRELGLNCPSDIALATVDALQFNDMFSPPFTCVVQPILEMAQAAAETLIARLDGHIENKTNITKEFQPKLQIGGTT